MPRSDARDRVLVTSLMALGQSLRKGAMPVLVFHESLEPEVVRWEMQYDTRAHHFVVTEVGQTWFDFTPEGGATISVALHPQAVFFDNAGNPSGIQAIKLDTPLEIDVRPAGGLQQATLIVALTADVQPQQQLAGQVVGVTGDVVTVATDLGDRCVRVGSATISLHTESSAGIDIGPGGIPDVQVGTTIDAVGIEDGGGCLQAQSVMVFTTAI